MADETYEHRTTDPILLEALRAPEVAAARAAARALSSSRYRGVSKNKNAASTTWSASVGAGGEKYPLGTYSSEDEAGLARNFGEELVPGAKRVKNVIPPDRMPDEAARKRVAARVVALLRDKGVLPPGEAGPVRPAPADRPTPAAGPAPAGPGHGGDDAAPASPA